MPPGAGAPHVVKFAFFHVSACSQPRSNVLSSGIWRSSQAWEMESKHSSISPPTPNAAGLFPQRCRRRPKSHQPCRDIAKAVRMGISASFSDRSRANAYRACMARSVMVKMPSDGCGRHLSEYTRVGPLPAGNLFEPISRPPAFFAAAISRCRRQRQAYISRRCSSPAARTLIWRLATAPVDLAA